jgi:hypothetical protein
MLAIHLLKIASLERVRVTLAIYRSQGPACPSIDVWRQKPSMKDKDARGKRRHELGKELRSRRNLTMAEFSSAAKSIVSREKAIVS